MKEDLKRCLMTAALVGAVCGAAAWGAQVDLGLAVSDGRLRSFYIAVGDHFRVAPRAVLDLRTRYRLLDDELPVIYFLAARANVGPQVVVDVRLGKRSWFEVAVHLGLSPEIFFVAVHQERIGPPYGNAYGYYRKHGTAGEWRKIVLTDREVIDLVNLRFLSEYHGLAPDEIMVLRGRHTSFVRIHDEIGRGKNAGRPGQGRDIPAKDSGRSSKAKGKKK